MPFPDSFIQELKFRNNIGDVVSSYVNLRRSGRNMVGLCPFHGEKTPSFHVYPDNGSFYCFGCHAGGDVITFVRKIEHLDYVEAVRFLADRAGMQVPERQVDDGMARLRMRILEINREAARFFYSVLNSQEGQPGMDYLRGRALTQRTIRHFGLGYAPPDRFALVNHLRRKGFSGEEVIQANVAFRGRNGGAVDRFSNRVMFPIIDLRGNVIAFGGRVLGDAKPKYLNTSDTPAFHKSSALFALNFAKDAGGDQLILAEGYMDVISLHQAGFPTAVATLGTALTAEQARLMARYAKEIVLCYDADTAGQNATARAIPMLREAGLLVKVLTVPNGKDPDEYIRSYGDQGYARFKNLLDTTGNDVEYRLQKLQQANPIEEPAGRVAYLTGAAEILAGLTNRIEQEVYAGRLAEEMSVDRSAILRQVDSLMKKRRREEKKKEFREYQQETAGLRDRVNPDKASNLRAAAAEEALLSAMLRYPETAEGIAGALSADIFITAFNRRVYAALKAKLDAGTELSLSAISGEFSEEEISSIARMMARYHDVPVSERGVQEYIQVLKTEKAALRARQAAEAEQPQELLGYLEALRKQKK
ncbi:DNA primase [Anaeromassilibacillus sp. An200]|uniref:DNA primase n=1 Tax=Candidatus Caccousia stercoris TaxID=2840723 RepID=A0A9D1FTI4_9FIRM|nr:DNA primase [Anaeromassilibacillus sp. An200]HIS79527.1 DNA primase [Candidatus Caccousia stercoris]